VLLVLGAGSQLGFSCEPACEQPYRAVGVRSDLYGDEEPPYEDWPVTGTARPPVGGVLDSDGDGVADTIEPTGSGEPLVVHRSSGDLVLTAPAGSTVAWTSEATVDGGDLDGDGRDEVLVATLVVTPDGGATGPYGLYVVPGATPDGTHAVDQVGAAPFGTDPDRSVAVQTAGDVDGDGRDDLVEDYSDDTTQEARVWLSTALDLTPGSGGPGTTPPPPSYVAAGRLFSPVPLAGRDALLLVTLFGATEQQVTLWLPGGALTFTTEGPGVPATVPATGERAEVVEDGNQAWLVAHFDYRSGSQSWAWDLDDLCAGAPAAAEAALGPAGP
jgi:hypothetical protein